MKAAAQEPLHFVYYCTGHGLGHATRVIEICKQLALQGHTLTVCTGAPASAFLREVPTSSCAIRKQILDSGSRQKDAFSVDMRGGRAFQAKTVQAHILVLASLCPAGSLEDHQKTCVLQRSALLATEQAWLQAVKPDLVVSDIVPLACAAAAAAGIPCICVSNFSWGEYFSPDFEIGCHD